MKRDELLKTAAELILKAITVDTTTKEPKGESQAGEGAAQAVDRRDVVSDDGIVAPGTGKPKGATLDMDGVPAGVRAKKNDGDAANGGKTLPDDESGSGAQQKDVQTFKAEDVMRAVSALAKSVEASNAAVTKKFDELAAKVESVGSLARKTDAALNGTVFNDAGEDRVRSVKSENGVAEIPLLDTAYSRRTA